MEAKFGGEKEGVGMVTGGPAMGGPPGGGGLAKGGGNGPETRGVGLYG